MSTNNKSSTCSSQSRVSFFLPRAIAADEEEPPESSSPLQWQMALCYLSFAATYAVSNLTPYGPFMALDLLPGRATPETVGKYSAFFTTGYIWGRSSCAEMWGSLADRRGRLPVLYISLLFGTVFSLLFGLSTNYFFAVAIRFLLGLSGDGGAVIKTMVCELAEEDRDLEAHSMNLVVSAWAFGTLLSPAIGGALSNPVEQYPNLSIWQDFPRLRNYMTTYRYFLPNLVASLLFIAGFFVVRFNLRETLIPPEQQSAEKNNPQNLPLSPSSSIQEHSTEQTPLLTSSTTTTPLDFNDSFALSPEALDFAREMDLHQTMRDAYLYSDGLAGAITTPEARKSMALSIYRRSTQRCSHIASHHPELAGNASTLENNDHAEETTSPTDNSSSTTITGLYSKILKMVMDMPIMLYLMDRDIRNHLLVYTIGSFIITFHMEAFPLFCLSQQDGLGISENTIGGIMMASGVTHALLQPKLYGFIFQKTGLKGSIHWATRAIIPVFLVIPFSLLSNGKGTDDLRWTSLTFLGIVIGVGRMFSVTFYSSMFVSLNNLVLPEQRCAFNSLMTRVTGSCKSMAPIAAGFFTSWAFTSGVVPTNSDWGAVLLYGILGLAGLALSAASRSLLGPDDLI